MFSTASSEKGLPLKKENRKPEKTLPIKETRRLGRGGGDWPVHGGPK